MKEYICHFDGSCTPVNPSGYMGAGLTIESDGKTFEVAMGFKKYDNNTNNVAEYHAFKKILESLSTKRDVKITIQGDSMLVINQMNGKSRIKNGAYVPLAFECLKLLDNLHRNNTVSIEWVSRDKNQRADYLSRYGASLSVISNENETRIFNK